MANTNPGLGTILQVSISSTFTTIANRVSLDGPSMEVGSVGTTTLDSTAETFRPTLPNAGEVSGSLFYDPQDPTHAYAFTAITAPSQTLDAFKLKFKDSVSTIFAFSGFFTKFAPNGMEIDGNLGADFTIKLSGIPTSTHT